MRTQPYYSLAKVRQLTVSGKCIINSKARQTAKEHFGWGKPDVLKALSKLQHKHFHKSDEKYDNPGIHVDYYKAINLLGENVYIHFRIENGFLIICSFKEI